MRILGIDSSTPRGSVALLENGHILIESSLASESTYSNCLLSTVDQVLAESRMNLNALDGFCVTTGPGSFTGLRVGVSLVKGFVLSTNKPFLGIDTLEAVAFQADSPDHPVCAILDARKKEVYAARFKISGQQLERLTPDRVTFPVRLCEDITETTVFIGSGLETYGGFLAERLGPFYIQKSLSRFQTAAAGAAMLGYQKFDSEKKWNLDELNIEYIRKSEAETNFSKTLN